MNSYGKFCQQESNDGYTAESESKLQRQATQSDQGAGESKPCQSNGATADPFQCNEYKLDPDNDSSEFRKSRYYPLLVFLTSGIILSCLGLAFSYATDNMIILRCFLAVGGWSILVGLLFQFRNIFVCKHCSAVRKCMDIEDEAEKVSHV